MKVKLLKCFFAFIMVLSWSTCIYYIYASDQTATVSLANYASNDALNENLVENYMLENSIDEEILFICAVGNPDCDYVQKNVIKPLTDELNVENFDFVQVVSIDESTQEYTAGKLRQKWSIENYPAFIKTAVNEKNEIEIISTLQWNSNDPFTSADLRSWMIDNDCWPGYVAAQDSGGNSSN